LGDVENMPHGTEKKTVIRTVRPHYTFLTNNEWERMWKKAVMA
jgi:hypothetical protein